MKKIIAAILFVLVTLVVGGGHALLQRKSFEPPVGRENLPLDSPPLALDKVLLGEVEVNNFYRTATVADKTYGFVFFEGEGYQIIFNDRDKSFLISILGSPFEQYRTEAEESLLKVLEISEAESCSLKVVITTPLFANREESGTQFPLSFCEGRN